MATAETTLGAPRIRARLEAARGRIRTVERIDRLAGLLIRLGGIGIVVSVLGILVFIMSEAWPLFRPAHGRLAGTLALAAAPPAPPAAAPLAPGGRRRSGGAPPSAPAPRRRPAPGSPAVPGVVLAMGADEYQLYLYAVRGAAPDRVLPAPRGDVGARVPAVRSRRRGGDLRLAEPAGRLRGPGDRRRTRGPGRRCGSVRATRPRSSPTWTSRWPSRGVATVDPAGRRRARRSDTRETESGRKVVAALLGDDEIALWTSEEAAEATEGTEAAAAPAPALETLRIPAGERITRLALGRAERLVAGTDQGNVYHWSLSGETRAHQRLSRGPRPRLRPRLGPGRRSRSWRARRRASSPAGSRAGCDDQDDGGPDGEGPRLRAPVLRRSARSGPPRATRASSPWARTGRWSSAT